MKSIFILALLCAATIAHAQTKSVIKGVSTNAITESLTFPSGKTLTISPGATINATGATITGFGSGGGSTAWGDITGTLASQTDLNTALGLKAPLASPTFTGTVTIPSGASISGYLTSATAATTYQPLDSDLTSIAALATTTHGRSLLTGADASASRTTLGLGTLATQSATISDYLTTASAATSYQPLDAELTALAGLTSAADRLPYYTGSGTASLATFTSAARSLLDDSSTAAMRSTLGLGGMAQMNANGVAITGGTVEADSLGVKDGAGNVSYLLAAPGVLALYQLPSDGTNLLSDESPLNASLLHSGTILVERLPAATTSAIGAVELATDGETSASVAVQGNDTRLANANKVAYGVAISDETTALTTGTAKITFRLPHAMTLTEVRLSLTTVSSSGTPTVDINEAGATILSTKLTCDVSEKTSRDAAVPAVISDSALADDAEITIDIDTAGTGATGAKVWLIGTR